MMTVRDRISNEYLYLDTEYVKLVTQAGRAAKPNVFLIAGDNEVIFTNICGDTDGK